ncbi:MAG: DUF2167 domain-containing protein [Alphaproteobacteria bacterium]|nr:DUF2167 domain-containing protein [Alphaproteobacteria bacterium]
MSDTEAASIDYSQLLADMQAGIRENNPELKKQGYPTYELVGWAEPPHYDQAEHKLYWAQELLFEGGDASTLNYFVRILGRGGVLEMNVIGDMKALPEINQKAPTLLSMVNFKDGQLYDQFDATTDATAAYGLAGLIAGGVAAKAGLFKVILGILAASWKFIAIGVVALGGVIARFFGARKG